MANDEVPQSPREKRYGFAPQVSFGIGIAAGAAFTEMDNEPTTIDRDVKELEIAGAHGSRKQNVNDFVIHNRNAMPKMPIEMFAKLTEFPDFLYATSHSVVEDASPAVFGKTFTFLDSQPDFQADAGHFLTLVERDPAVSKSTQMIDAIVNTHTITLSGDEPLKLSMDMIGKALPDIAFNPTGTWTRTAPTDLFFRSDIDICTIDFGAGVVNFHLTELELTLGYEVTGVGQDGAGGFDTYMLVPAHTFKLGVVKDADWETAMANHAAGTVIDCRVGWGNATAGSVLGDLDFAWHGKMDGGGGAEKQHDDPMSGVLTGKMLDDGATEQITIIIADGVDHSW